MILTSFSVHGLFGTFDHKIDFDKNERIKIIHGPNGFGKTSILRLINAFFNSKYSTMRQIPYSKMLFTFNGGSVIEVRRTERQGVPGGKGRTTPEHAILEFTLSVEGLHQKKVHQIKPPEINRERIPLSAIDDIIPGLTRIGPEEWLHQLTGRQLTLGDVIDEFPDQLPLFEGHHQTYPDWLKSVVSQLPVYLIEAQRLLLPAAREVRLRRLPKLPSSSAMSSAVSVYSREMVDRIQESLAKSAEVSQSLDSSFPKRLLQGTTNGNASMEDIRERYDAQVQKRTRLMEAGLLDREEEFPLPNKDINEAERHVLALYVKDVEEKLAIFDDILRKIELFKEMINRRFQYKKLRIDRKEGFVFEISQGRFVPPAELSSGEQHEVVLAHQLLFNVPEGALILIDEPELSLHVAWQQDFLKDLEKISAVIRMDFLIATHSPQVINDRWDVTTALEGPKQ